MSNGGNVANEDASPTEARLRTASVIDSAVSNMGSSADPRAHAISEDSISDSRTHKCTPTSKRKPRGSAGNVRYKRVLTVKTWDFPPFTYLFYPSHVYPPSYHSIFPLSYMYTCTRKKFLLKSVQRWLDKSAQKSHKVYKVAQGLSAVTPSLWTKWTKCGYFEPPWPPFPTGPGMLVQSIHDLSNQSWTKSVQSLKI